MAWWKRSAQLLAAIAFASTLAAADDCKSDSTFVISSQDDADKLGKCTEYTGDVGLSPSASGNLTVSGLEKITGKLLTESAGDKSASLVGITFEKLATVEGSVSVSSVDSLQFVSFPALTTVGGDIEISSLPELNTLKLPSINSIGSFKLESAPKLLKMSVGDSKHAKSTDSKIGLKHITGESDRSIVVKNVGVDSLDGLLDLYNATLVDLSELPNLNRVILSLWHIDEVRIRGNGNLTVYMWEKATTETVQLDIGKFDIGGVKHISPCLSSNVQNFVVVNNTAEYLRFDFRGLQRLEVRENPNLKRLIPWGGSSLTNWWFQNITIKNNPELLLAYDPPRSSNDTLTANDCPYMFEHSEDKFRWLPWDMKTIDIDANIDNTYFSTFVTAWQNQTGRYAEGYGRGPEVNETFIVTSSNSTFDCSGLDRLRTKTTAIQAGTYSCQGQSQAAYVIDETAGAVRMSMGVLATLLPLFIAACVLL
ncbi:unnamed protein product [Clonostachys rosea f. rosea IK726]|uniref:Uncharacterized protein n=1 Tax=Clonostachys rosea f. rosea IK726 TaxID=1349383 RepID=A0ACA9USV8_BIOOC|nr:unnamed protein product [Clonostachys rosea f. rosea IK726]